MAVEAARVGHENAEKRHSHSGHGPKLADIERAEGAHISGMLKPRGKTFSIVCGEGHEKIELLFQRQVCHARPLSRKRRHITRRNPEKQSSFSMSGPSFGRAAIRGRPSDLGQSDAYGFLRLE
jgi:hypothetical protein